MSDEISSSHFNLKESLFGIPWWVIQIGLPTLWLLLGALWGWRIGLAAMGQNHFMDDLIQLLAPAHAPELLGSFLALIIVLSLVGCTFWFIPHIPRKLELSFLSFTILLWIGLLALCPVPRSLERAHGIIELVYTRSAYAILGDDFSSILRNNRVLLTITLLALAASLAGIVRSIFKKEV